MFYLIRLPNKLTLECHSNRLLLKLNKEMNNSALELLDDIKDLTEFIKRAKTDKEKQNKKASLETMFCYCLNSTLGFSILVWIVFVFLFGARFVFY